MKKIYLLILSLVLFLPIKISASEGALVKIGNQYYDNLLDAINNSKSSDTITLISDNQVAETININKNIRIDLNGHNITANEAVFKVQGGALHLTGKGKVYETNPNYGAVMIYGSTNPDDIDYSVVKVDRDVYLEGWSGIFITHDSLKSYGILVNFDGSINAVNDTNGGTGIGIYVNGNIKHNSNYPIVNIGENAKITSTGNGIYMAGYMELNINGGYIQGDESGIGMKSGILNMNNGTIISTGSDETPSTGNNNGINASGTGIQIESNPNYAGNMKINIKDGLIKSKNSYAFYEYIGNGTTSLANSIKITSGQLESGKNNFYVSNNFSEKHPYFIEGGLYSSDPSEYLFPGYNAILNKNNLYEVSLATFSQVSKIEQNTPKVIIYLLIAGLIAVLSFSIYKYVKTKGSL